MKETELKQLYERLGVARDVSTVGLERAHMRKSFAAGQAGDPETLAELKAAFAVLQPIVREQTAARETALEGTG